jgi:hypothetical protein
MAFSAPNVFTANTVLTSAALEGNFEALRVYLHNGVVVGDLEASKWIQTRHLQPPELLPYQGLQHGLSGYQGGQSAGGMDIRLAFATKFLTGQGRTQANTFVALPNAAFQLEVRRSMKLLFHYWWEWEAGPDVSTAGYQVAAAERLVWLAPWVGSVPAAFTTYRDRAQETRNGGLGLGGGYPIGADDTYAQNGGYDAKQGCLAHETTAGVVTFGLATHSQVDRVGVVNWGVAVEGFYL